MIELSIQIVNYNTKQYLSFLLPMIFKDLERSGINYKVGILDNASSDDLSDLQEFYTGNNRISFYTNDKNVGFGTGHNILSQKNDSLYTLLLNPDLQFIEPSTIVRLLDNLKDNSGVVAVGPKLITYKGKSQWWDHGELEGLIASWLDGLGLPQSLWKLNPRLVRARGERGIRAALLQARERQRACRRVDYPGWPPASTARTSS